MKNIVYVTLTITSLVMTVAWIVELGIINFVLMSVIIGLIMGLYASMIDARVLFNFKVMTIFQATLLLGVGSMIGPIGPVIILTAISTVHSVVWHIFLKHVDFPMLGE
jgi:hypothetical protein